MPIIDKGQRNSVSGVVPDDLTISFFANDCHISLPETSKVTGTFEFRRNEQLAKIGEGTRGKFIVHLKGDKVSFIVGTNVTVNNVLWANLAEGGCDIEIGNDCLIANVQFRPSDSHKIFDMDTGERLNAPTPISVGNKVWIAQEVLVLKGTRIGDGCVVGARSTLNGIYPENSILAGTPAKVVRQNVRWEE